MGRGGGKVLDFDPEDSSLGGHVNKKLWNHQALRLGVWGPFWGGAAIANNPFSPWPFACPLVSHPDQPPRTLEK